MTTSHTIGRPARTPCWHCRGYVGMTAQGTAASCVLAGSLAVRTAPASGCAFWEREPGVDDEPGWTPVDFMPAHAAMLRAPAGGEYCGVR